MRTNARLTTYKFTDDEIQAIGLILTRYIQNIGIIDWTAEIADDVLHKMGKDIGRIYRAEAKKAKVDISGIKT